MTLNSKTSPDGSSITVGEETDREKLCGILREAGEAFVDSTFDAVSVTLVQEFARQVCIAGFQEGGEAILEGLQAGASKKEKAAERAAKAIREGVGGEDMERPVGFFGYNINIVDTTEIGQDFFGDLYQNVTGAVVRDSSGVILGEGKYDPERGVITFDPPITLGDGKANIEYTTTPPTEQDSIETLTGELVEFTKKYEATRSRTEGFLQQAKETQKLLDQIVGDLPKRQSPDPMAELKQRIGWDKEKGRKWLRAVEECVDPEMVLEACDFVWSHKFPDECEDTVFEVLQSLVDHDQQTESEG